MFPEAKNHPTGSFEVGAILLIASAIPLQLRPPVREVLRGRAAMERALVPKATVDEHSDLLPREHDVGAHRAAAKQDPEVAAVTETGGMEDRS